MDGATGYGAPAMFRAPHRHPGPVGASAEGYLHVPHKCRACGWGGEIGVRGEAYTMRMPQYVGGERDAEKRAADLASRLVAPDARESAELARCPRCGARDERAIGALTGRAVWRGTAVVLLAAMVRFCAGPMPWSFYVGALGVAAVLAAITFFARLYKADRAVFFTRDG